MARNITCDIDSFSKGVEELLGDIPEAAREKVGVAVEKSIRRGVKAVKGYASEGGLHEWSKEYVDGFSSRIERGAMTSGEIGNRNKPGLVHLLEKGHATLTGRRTRAHPHMDKAFEDIQEDFVDLAAKALDEAVS